MHLLDLLISEVYIFYKNNKLFVDYLKNSIDLKNQIYFVENRSQIEYLVTYCFRAGMSSWHGDDAGFNMKNEKTKVPPMIPSGMSGDKRALEIKAKEAQARKNQSNNKQEVLARNNNNTEIKGKYAARKSKSEETSDFLTGSSKKK